MTKKSIKRLHSLDPAEVSLVKRGANRKKFVVFKSKDGKGGPASGPLDAADVLDAIRNFPPELQQRTDAAISRVAKGDAAQALADQAEMSARLSERAQSALQAVARILAPFRDEITGPDVDALVDALGIECADDEEEAADEGADLIDVSPVAMSAETQNPKVEEAAKASKDQSMTDTVTKGDIAMDMSPPAGVASSDHKAAMGKAKDAYMNHLAGMKKMDETVDSKKAKDGEEEMCKAKGDDENEMEGDVKKSADLEAIFKSHKALVQEHKDLIAKSSSLEAELVAERSDRVLKEYVAKAEALAGCGADVQELALVLKGFHDRGDTEGLERMTRVLKASAEQANSANAFGGNLFGVAGSSAPSQDANSPQARLDALVTSVVQKNTNGKSEAQIYNEVIQTPEGRRLYAATRSF